MKNAFCILNSIFGAGGKEVYRLFINFQYCPPIEGIVCSSIAFRFWKYFLPHFIYSFSWKTHHEKYLLIFSIIDQRRKANKKKRKECFEIENVVKLTKITLKLRKCCYLLSILQWMNLLSNQRWNGTGQDGMGRDGTRRGAVWWDVVWQGGTGKVRWKGDSAFG